MNERSTDVVHKSKKRRRGRGLSYLDRDERKQIRQIGEFKLVPSRSHPGRIDVRASDDHLVHQLDEQGLYLRPHRKRPDITYDELEMLRMWREHPELNPVSHFQRMVQAEEDPEIKRYFTGE